MFQQSSMSTGGRSCRVCCDRSDGAHFGIDSCRACAAFFRRSVAMQKKYVCRQGSNSCDINKSVRCICRKCRFEKCLSAGMLPESVQNKRDHIVPKIPEETEPQKYSQFLTVSPSDNETLQRSTQSAFQLVNHPQSSIFRVPTVEPYTQPTTSTQMDLPHILMKITQNYRQLCAVRKSTELSMNGSSLRNMFDESIKGADLVYGSTLKTSNILRAQMPALAEFVNTTFDEFALLSQEEKWSVFHAFLVMMFSMDSIYRTYRLVPPDLYSTMNIVTETTFVDSNDIMQFFVDAPQSKLSKEELARMMRDCMSDKYRLCALKSLKKLEITEHEYSALLALGLWSTYTKSSSETIERVAAEARAKIFDELHLLYRTDGTDNYAVRLGELVMLNGTFQLVCCKFREDIELFNLFDLFQEDTFLYDITKQ
ncbi:unnamed protein product [Cylicocyclus nassatus]|uniref:Uncharacterized protein n=1 Tax=Cylicocyclus nassatus TaxID=53992 RepID=A0AA36HHJ9_CYLNA|nr:unnamed protein product [Cylicocyclus nassatus]